MMSYQITSVYFAAEQRGSPWYHDQLAGHQRNKVSSINHLATDPETCHDWMIDKLHLHPCCKLNQEYIFVSVCLTIWLENVQAKMTAWIRSWTQKRDLWCNSSLLGPIKSKFEHLWVREGAKGHLRTSFKEHLQSSRNNCRLLCSLILFWHPKLPLCKSCQFNRN